MLWVPRGRIRSCDDHGRELVISDVIRLEPMVRHVNRSVPVRGTVVEVPLLEDVAGEVGLDAQNLERVADLAAVAVTRIAWRDGPVEDWHSIRFRRITDPEMMRCNAATSRAVRSVLGQRLFAAGQQHSDGVAVLAAIGDVLADRGRALPDGRTLIALAPDAWQLARYDQHVAACVRQWQLVASRIGMRPLLTLLACHAATFNWRWWLSTGWMPVVATFIAGLDDPARWAATVFDPRVHTGSHPDGLSVSRLHESLLAGPDRMSRASVSFCLRAGLGAPHAQHCGLPLVRRRLLPTGYFRLLDPQADIGNHCGIGST